MRRSPIDSTHPLVFAPPLVARRMHQWDPRRSSGARAGCCERPAPDRDAATPDSYLPLAGSARCISLLLAQVGRPWGPRPRVVQGQNQCGAWLIVGMSPSRRWARRRWPVLRVPVLHVAGRTVAVPGGVCAPSWPVCSLPCKGSDLGQSCFRCFKYTKLERWTALLSAPRVPSLLMPEK